MSSVNSFIPCADVVQTAEGNIVRAFDGKHDSSTAESKTWRMYGNFKRENREIPLAPWRRRRGRLVNLTEGTANMYADGKSDDSIVPSTRANKAATAVAESVEERESPKGTVVHPPWTSQTQCRARRHLHGMTMTTGSETPFRDRLT